MPAPDCIVVSDGMTQALDLDEAVVMARDLILGMRDVPEDEVALTLIAESRVG